ncbi:MAG: DUF501 domain-containing protein [Acidimicrobiales bacterium]
MTTDATLAVTAGPPSPDADRAAVARLLGRAPQGAFEVILRRHDGSPVVVANQPLLDSGRPMPTRFWLVDRALSRAVGTLESEGGVKRAEAEIEPALIQAAHDRYATERDTLLDPEHAGPRPSGGVGGTRVGVKCLHAHLANHLAGHDDPVGAWVIERLAESGHRFDPSEPGT